MPVCGTEGPSAPIGLGGWDFGLLKGVPKGWMRGVRGGEAGARVCIGEDCDDAGERAADPRN